MHTAAKIYPYPPDLEAEIIFSPTEQGGRSVPGFSGYRAQFYYDEHDWDAVYEFPDNENVSPGETARVFLRFLSPSGHVGRVHAGMDFHVREGTRVVARGRVTEILKLAESAERVRT